MDKIFTSNSWSKILRYLPERSSKFAAVAYVSKGSPLKFGNGDILVCDASETSIRNGNTDAKTLLAFKRNGAQIFSCGNLHAKVVVCGEYAIVGSSNLSKSSEEILLEATLITDRRQVRAQSLGLIHSLMKASIELDENSLNQLVSIPVTKKFTRRAKGKKIKDVGTSSWVVSVVPIKTVSEDEQILVEKGELKAREFVESENSEIGWIRFIGQSAFRRQAKVGDLVLEITKRGRTASVCEPRPILHRQDKGKWTRFYLEVKDDIQEMSWSDFNRRLKKSGISNFSKNSTKELSELVSKRIDEIWEE